MLDRREPGEEPAIEGGGGMMATASLATSGPLVASHSSVALRRFHVQMHDKHSAVRPRKSLAEDPFGCVLRYSKFVLPSAERRAKARM